jgi:Putative peptidoglycan binding domain
MSAVVPSLAAPPRRGPTSPKTPTSKHNKAKPVAHQTTIDPARATELQTALIKAGYLTGTPSGVWDAQAQAAMQKLQADNGWQTKLVPDSRAIIKLGLGPAQDNVAQVTPAPNPAAN